MIIQSCSSHDIEPVPPVQDAIEVIIILSLRIYHYISELKPGTNRKPGLIYKPGHLQ